MVLAALVAGLILVLILVVVWSRHYHRTRIQLTLDVQRDPHPNGTFPE